MNETIIVGLLSLVGSIVGTIGGILAANKLTVYRIEQLEKKVSLHNNLVERMYKVEGRTTELEHDVKDMKGYHRPN